MGSFRSMDSVFGHLFLAFPDYQATEGLRVRLSPSAYFAKLRSTSPSLLSAFSTGTIILPKVSLPVNSQIAESTAGLSPAGMSIPIQE